MADKPGDRNLPSLTISGKKVWDQTLGESDYIIASITGDKTDVPEVFDKKSIDLDVSRRQAFHENSVLTGLIETKSSPSDIVDGIISEIAEELSHIKWERQKSVLEGRSSSAMSIKRIESLRVLADLLIKKSESFKSSSIDFRNPKFKAVIRLWMELVYDALQKVGVDEAVIDMVFKQLEADIVDWERKVIETVG